MTKFFFSLAIFSLFLFSSCSNNEILDDTTSINIETEFVDQNVAEEAIVEFSIDNNNSQIFENEDLLLTNNSTNAVSYLWDFGNGDTSTEANPSYKYENHGIFDISLVITDRDGNKKEVSHDITVICLFENQIHTSGN